MTADADTADRRAGRLALLTLLGIVVAVQVVVLYSPSSHGGLLFPQADKVVHVLVFLVPVAVALLAGLRPAAVVALFVAQAVVSEVVQGTLLPAARGTRSTSSPTSPGSRSASESGTSSTSERGAGRRRPPAPDDAGPPVAGRGDRPSLVDWTTHRGARAHGRVRRCRRARPAPPRPVRR